MNATTTYIVILIASIGWLPWRRVILRGYRRAVSYRGVYEPEDVLTAVAWLLQRISKFHRWYLFSALIVAILALLK